jgi:hypothetical protein
MRLSSSNRGSERRSPRAEIYGRCCARDSVPLGNPSGTPRDVDLVFGDNAARAGRGMKIILVEKRQ